MAYSDFKLKDIKTSFNVSIEEQQRLFADVPVHETPVFLQTLLENWVPLAHAIATEKARSEFIIAPVLSTVRDIQNKQISLFSGVSLNIEAEKGLVGICDFVLSLSPEQLALTAPLVTILEAKNENINAGIPQCMAELIAARLFNEKEGNDIKILYGCVTTGTIWKFIKYQGNILYVDQDDYYIRDIDKVLGIFVSMFQQTDCVISVNY